MTLTRPDMTMQERFRVIAMIFGAHDDEYDYHKMGIDVHVLRHLLEKAGFVDDLAVRIATDAEFRTHLKSLHSTRAEALYEDERAVEQVASFFEGALANAGR